MNRTGTIFDFDLLILNELIEIKNVYEKDFLKKVKTILKQKTTVKLWYEFVDYKEDVSTDKETLDLVKHNAYSLVDNLRLDKQIRIFSGVRAVSDTGDFVIEEVSPCFINVAGIQSPDLTASPSIAEMV